MNPSACTRVLLAGKVSRTLVGKRVRCLTSEQHTINFSVRIVELKNANVFYRNIFVKLSLIILSDNKNY